MKYWRGYLVAAICAAIGAAAVAFAQAHPVLIDMIYPYVTRLYQSTMADWTGGMTACLWQVGLVLFILGVIIGIVLIVIKRRNLVRFAGWVLAIIAFVSMLNSVIWSMGAYASPIADDIHLSISDYTVSELNEATVYFRDQANQLVATLERQKDGSFGTFEEVAAKAYDGFAEMTYNQASPVFASSDAPVKKLSMAGLFLSKGDSGITVALTGESAVSPRVPDACLPFAICKELSHRISIYGEADAQFAAFLACINNPDPAYQYSGYLMAYYYCYEALNSISTSTAQACAAKTDEGVSQAMGEDLKQAIKFYGERVSAATVQTEANITTDDGLNTLVSYASYNSVTDLFASWYIQSFILPNYIVEEEEFDPLDETQVDLSGIVNAPTEAAS